MALFSVPSTGHRRELGPPVPHHHRCNHRPKLPHPADGLWPRLIPNVRGLIMTFAILTIPTRAEEGHGEVHKPSEA